MALNGDLEDLGISDILQIISLSKKSGVLALESEGRTGRISFRDGQVVRASSSRFPENLGQLLCKAGLVTPEQVEAALVQQRSLTTHRPIGAILSTMYQVPQAKIEAVVKKQIEEIVFDFLTWGSGSFTFRLEDPQAFGETSINAFDFMLDKGVAPQWFVVKEQKLAASAETMISDSDVLRGVEEYEKKLNKTELQRLRGMLAELENPHLGGGIILLLLRYASEILNRAVIFDVRGRHLIGLGQFGLHLSGASADAVVRNMRLSVVSGSLFDRVLLSAMALRGRLGHFPDEEQLVRQIGHPPGDVLVAPLISDGKVVALLYGDNFPDGEDIVPTDAFEIFLAHAGAAMEKALLNGN